LHSYVEADDVRIQLLEDARPKQFHVLAAREEQNGLINWCPDSASRPCSKAPSSVITRVTRASTFFVSDKEPGASDGSVEVDVARLRVSNTWCAFLAY
jgi:hypothetical protein